MPKKLLPFKVTVWHAPVMTRWPASLLQAASLNQLYLIRKGFQGGEGLGVGDDGGGVGGGGGGGGGGESVQLPPLQKLMGPLMS